MPYHISAVEHLGRQRIGGGSTLSSSMRKRPLTPLKSSMTQVSGYGEDRISSHTLIPLLGTVPGAHVLAGDEGRQHGHIDSRHQYGSPAIGCLQFLLKPQSPHAVRAMHRNLSPFKLKTITSAFRLAPISSRT